MYNILCITCSFVDYAWPIKLERLQISLYPKFFIIEAVNLNLLIWIRIFEQVIQQRYTKNSEGNTLKLFIL